MSLGDIIIKDYKDWIQEKAEELAQTTFNKGYYELTESQQMQVYKKAEELYWDEQFDIADNLIDEEKLSGKNNLYHILISKPLFS